MPKIYYFLLLVPLWVSCNLGRENQTVEIDTAEEVKMKEKQTADIADQHFKDGMTGKIFHNYLQIKIALGNDDSEMVAETAKSMAASFDAPYTELRFIARELSETSDIETQRMLFSQLTDEVGPMFEDTISGGTIYKKFCPMAFEGKGAFWYADVADDVNPYFGAEMPKCGRVEKEIKGK